jgi:very-short-patch-repair endonuclease
MVIRVSARCSELLEFQRGVLARWQADCPADVAAIDTLLRTDRWRPLYRGVYLACTGLPSWEGVLWAALRRCGPEAALSHSSAAELDGIGGRARSAVHVTIPDRRRVTIARRELAGELPRVIMHRSARLALAVHPARTPPRTRPEETVLDLVDGARSFDVAFFWLSTACSKGVVTPDQIQAALARRKKMRWRAGVLIALDEIAEGVLSNLERQYLTNVERPHRLPKAKRQVRMSRDETSAYLDNFYDSYDLAVELDGRAAHPVEARWQDIHRDNYFARAGIITLRYSWADVTGRPCLVAAEIAAILRQRGWAGTISSCGPSCQASRP